MAEIFTVFLIPGSINKILKEKRKQHRGRRGWLPKGKGTKPGAGSEGNEQGYLAKGHRHLALCEAAILASFFSYSFKK